MTFRYQWSKVGDDHADLMHYDSYTQTLTYARDYKKRGGGLAGAVPPALHGGEQELVPPSLTQPPITRALDRLRALSDPHVFSFSRQQLNSIADAARYVVLLGTPWIGPSHPAPVPAPNPPAPPAPPVPPVVPKK